MVHACSCSIPRQQCADFIRSNAPYVYRISIVSHSIALHDRTHWVKVFSRCACVRAECVEAKLVARSHFQLVIYAKRVLFATKRHRLYTHKERSMCCLRTDSPISHQLYFSRWIIYYFISGGVCVSVNKCKCSSMWLESLYSFISSSTKLHAKRWIGSRRSHFSSVGVSSLPAHI